jgi:hypothetical protein
MMTKFAKSLVYVASFIPLYLLLVIKLIFTPAIQNRTLIQTWLCNGVTHKLPLALLALLLMVSLVWQNMFFKQGNNGRIYQKVSDNATIESVSFIIPYIASFVTIDLNFFALIANVVIFILLGIAFVYSDKLFLCPFFLFSRFKLYKNDTLHIFSRHSFEELRLSIDENKDGIEIRELCRNIYIQL